MVAGIALPAESCYMPTEKPDAPQDGKKLLDATRPFAEESRIKSWWYLGSTLVVLVAVLVLAAVLPWWPLRLAASIAGGLVLVRTFIIYHDYMHGSLLQGSRLARVVLYSIGLLMLTPPRHWRFAHNFHHAHVGKVIVAKEDAFPILTSDIGSFPLMSTESWQRATTWQRLRYRIIRHPLTILCRLCDDLFARQLRQSTGEKSSQVLGRGVFASRSRWAHCFVVAGCGFRCRDVFNRAPLRDRRGIGCLSFLCATYVRRTAHLAD